MINLHFAQPVLCLDDFCLNEIPKLKIITKHVLDSKQKSSGTLKANIHTTHWYNQSLHRHEAYQPFCKKLISVAQKFAKDLGYERSSSINIINMWANEAGKHDYHQMHGHGGALVSGVYYIQSPPTAKLNFASLFEDYDITPDRKSKYSEIEVSYDCKPGRLLLFKGMTRHGYDAHNSDTSKISIAFNFSRL